MNFNGEYDKTCIDETEEQPFLLGPLFENVKRKSRLGQRSKLYYPGITGDNHRLGTHIVKEPSLNFQEWLRQAPIKENNNANKENICKHMNESPKNSDIRSKFWNDVDINKITDQHGFINISKLCVNVPLYQSSDNINKGDNCDAKNVFQATGSSVDEVKNNFSYTIDTVDCPLNLSIPKVTKAELTNSTNSSHSSLLVNDSHTQDPKTELINSSESTNSSSLSPNDQDERNNDKLETAYLSKSDSSSSKIINEEPISTVGSIEVKAEDQSKSQNKCVVPNTDFEFERPQPVLPLNRSCQQITIRGISYQVLNELGRGGSSKVYQVLNPSTNQLLGIKKVDLTDLDPMIAEGYLNEVKLLNSLQHCQSVIKMFDSEVINKNRKKLLLMVMEKGETDLSKLIREVNKTSEMSISMIIHYWSEMLKAVEGIHKSGIIHSDLKPANFLLVSGRLKLIDFGIASKIQSDMTSVHKEFATGTWNYMSPEALRNTNSSNAASIYKITYKSDVWSLGCILYNLVYGRTPFQHITNTLAKLQAIVDSSVEVNFPTNKDVPPALMTSLKGCLQKDPKQRSTVSQLLSIVTTAFQYFGCDDIQHKLNNVK